MIIIVSDNHYLHNDKNNNIADTINDNDNENDNQIIALIKCPYEQQE